VNSGVYKEASMSKTALSTGSNVNGSLKWEVFVAPGIPTAASDLPPGAQERIAALVQPSAIGELADKLDALGAREQNPA
jgi:hypothetical protein